MPETKIKLPLLDAQNDVAEFHRVMGVPVRTRVPYYMTPPGRDFRLGAALAPEIALRASLIEEEMKETITALRHGDVVGIADGIADSIYVLLGTAVQLGIFMPDIWNEVQRSNMSKVGPDGRVLRRADGKVLKPSTFSPPDIAGILNRQAALPEAPVEG